MKGGFEAIMSRMQTKTARTLCWGVLVCGAVTGVALSLAPPFQPDAASRAASDASAAGPLRCAPEPGFSAAYRIRVDAELRYDPARWAGAGGGDKAPQSSRETLVGRLHAQAIEPREDGVLVMFRLDPLERATTGQQPVALRGQWSEPFYAVLRQDCRISAYGFAETAPAEVVNRLQGLVQGLSMALGSSRRGDSWLAHEWDQGGLYTAAYAHDAAPHAFTKRRRRYLRVQSAPGEEGPVRTHIVKSETHAALDAELAWLSRLDGKEALRLDFSHDGLAADVVIATTLQTLDDAERIPMRMKALSDLRWRRDSAPPLATEPDVVEAPEQLKHASLDAVLGSFAQLFRSGDDLGAVDTLKLFLRAHPEQAQVLVAKLAGGEIPTDLEAVVFHALEVADTPEAHLALLDALGDEHTPENRARAAAALPDIPHPNQHTLEGLRRASNDAVTSEPEQTEWVRNAATLAIGTLETRTRELNPALAEQSREVLRESLAQRKTPEERAAVLAAIGNSGNPALVEDVKPFLHSDNELLRSQSIGALRRMPIQATQSLFSDLIQAEADPRLRAKIANTYRAQLRTASASVPETLLASATAQLAREQDTRARASLIELIGPACATSELATRSLAEHFAHESDPDLLKLIGRFVAADKLGT